MTERLRSDSAKNQTNSAKMSEGDLGTRKTLFVLVIVVGCFAVLWPKVFYPMMVGPTNQRMKPNNLDKGCCDVISDIDVNTIKIMTELCNNIIQRSDQKPLKGQEVITRCRTEVLNKCGIDISAVLQEQVRLGRSFKQIVDEVRSFNGSLCLKYKFGVSPWRLGVSHRVTVNLAPVYIRQERPAHLRPEMLHPALREKGRAIAQPYQQQGKASQPKFVDGRPGPVPGVRPPLGAGAGHVVHPQQKGLNSMGIIMPIYTVGIVIFFSYTLMKLLFKKKPEGPGGGLYPPVEPSMSFRKEVFESAKSRPPRQPGSIVNAMTALLDEVDQELEARRKASEVASQESTSNGTLLANGSAKPSQEHEQPSVKVLGMEMTASCEGGERWSRPESPVIPNTPPPPPEPVEPPQEIYLEGALPAQSQLLVTDSTTETETSASSSSADPAVVLASKMTLSVISLDSQENENGVEPAERNKLRNGDLIDTEHEPFDDDIIDESKYTTASGATAAERDISEGERTDGEDGIEEDMEKLPDLMVDNGVQQIEDIDYLQDIEAELNLDDEREIEDAVILESKPDDDDLPGKVDEIIEDIIDETDAAKDKAVKFSEELIEMAMAGISDVIDDALDVVKGVSEQRSVADEPEKDDPSRKSAVKFSSDPADDDVDDISPKSAVKFSANLIDDDIEEVPRKSAVKFSADQADDDVPRKSAVKFSSDQADDDVPRKSAVKFSSDPADDVPQKSAVKFSTESENDDIPQESAVQFSADVIGDDTDERILELMSAEDIENIGDVIDDVITIGTRMSELISAEREADSDELDEDIEREASLLKFNIEDIIDMPSEEEEDARAVIIENVQESPETDKITIDPTQFRILSEAESTDDDSPAKVETKPSDLNG